MAVQKITLSLKPDGVAPIVYVNQYDVGRVFEIEVLDVDGSAYNFTTETVVVCGTKPSGTGFSYNATASGSVVTVTTTGQMTVVDGTVRCGVIITKGSVTIGTLIFNMYVQKNALTTDTIIDSNDFGSIITDAVLEWMNDHDYAINDIVRVSDTEPQTEFTKIWIRETTGEEVQVPTYEEFEPLESSVNEMIDTRINLWSDNKTYSFNGTQGITLSESLPAGNYTVAALVTSESTLTQYSRFRFADDDDTIAYVLFERDELRTYNVTLDRACAFVQLMSDQNASDSHEAAAVWDNIMIFAGSDVDIDFYLPHISAIDSFARNLLGEIDRATITNAQIDSLFT